MALDLIYKHDQTLGLIRKWLASKIVPSSEEIYSSWPHAY